MKILILGNAYQCNAIATKFADGHDIKISDHYGDLEGNIFLYDVIFDCLINESPEYFELYNENKKSVVFLHATNSSLAEIQHVYGPFNFPLFGFNGLPYFLELPKWEISSYHQDNNARLQAIMHELEQEYHLVDDRVGMVAARVIAMIINEAYYTLQEGTANKEAIDTGMKLGTNYPYGPFEWAEKIGLDHIYELLEALYEDTKDDRYKICPLLKKEYLHQFA